MKKTIKKETKKEIIKRKPFIRLNTRISEDQMTIIKAKAKRDGITQGEAVRSMLRDYKPKAK